MTGAETDGARPERLTMTVAEAADAIGVSSRHLYDLVRRGDFPAVRLGRRIVVPLSAVNEVLSSATTRMREEDAR